LHYVLTFIYWYAVCTGGDLNGLTAVKFRCI